MSTAQPADRSPRATGKDAGRPAANHDVARRGDRLDRSDVRPGEDVDPRRCAGEGACRSYRPGHLLHFIHAGRISRTPWGWRDAVVREISTDNVAVVDYLDGSGTAEIWQHRDLSVAAPPGMPVRLHERYYALAAGRAVLNVLLLRGIGPVPEPASPDLWAGEGEVIAVDLATGDGLTSRRQ